MNCDEIKDLIIINIYGKLNASDKDGLEKHLGECPNCARLYHQTEIYGGLFIDEEYISLPSWDKSWQVISKRVFKERKYCFSSFVSNPRLALAGAAVCLIFVIGFFIGRYFLLPKPNQYFSNFPRAQAKGSPLQAYAENLELLLINFMNRGDGAIEQDFSKIEHKVIADMLVQTRVLKYLISQKDDQYLNDILEDFEFILVCLANLKPGDRDTADQLAQFIREKALKLKLQQLVKDNSTI